MLDKAIGAEPSGFIGFDRTKNVQDQLQEMIGCHGIKSLMAVLYILGENLDYYEELSMEQLWLAFTMSEKFNKIWNGESWIAKS